MAIISTQHLTLCVNLLLRSEWIVKRWGLESGKKWLQVTTIGKMYADKDKDTIYIIYNAYVTPIILWWLKWGESDILSTFIFRFIIMTTAIILYECCIEYVAVITRYWGSLEICDFAVAISSARTGRSMSLSVLTSDPQVTGRPFPWTHSCSILRVIFSGFLKHSSSMMFTRLPVLSLRRIIPNAT